MNISQSLASYSLWRPSAAASPKTGASEAEAQTKPTGPSATDAFLTEAHKTPAQRMREAVLKSLNLSEDDLNSMPSEQRTAVEQRIADEVKRRLQGSGKDAKRGATIDLTA